MDPLEVPAEEGTPNAGKISQPLDTLIYLDLAKGGFERGGEMGKRLTPEWCGLVRNGPEGGIKIKSKSKSKRVVDRGGASGGCGTVPPSQGR